MAVEMQPVTVAFCRALHPEGVIRDTLLSANWEMTGGSASLCILETFHSLKR